MEYILIIIYSILIVIFLPILLLSLFNSIKYGVPQVGTFGSDFKVMKKYFKNNKKFKLKGKKIVDLGSGTGKTLRFFEKEFGMRTFGYEIDLFNYLLSKLLNKLYGTKSIFIKCNYFKKDLAKFNFIYVYLFPELMKNIEKKIWSDCKKGTIIISNAFKFEKHKPIEIIVDNNNKEEVYIYKI